MSRSRSRLSSKTASAGKSAGGGRGAPAAEVGPSEIVFRASDFDRRQSAGDLDAVHLDQLFGEGKPGRQVVDALGQRLFFDADAHHLGLGLGGDDFGGGGGAAGRLAGGGVVAQQRRAEAQFAVDFVEFGHAAGVSPCCASRFRTV